MRAKTKVPKGLKTVCRRVIKSEGVRTDGKLKKGYKYAKGGKIVKIGTTAKTTKPKKKSSAKRK